MAACGRRCDREREFELAEGQMVCSFCPEWMIECEAMDTLAKPLLTRRVFLRQVEQSRGTKAAEDLKQRMIAIHAIRKRNS